MLVGEQAVPIAKRLIAGEPVTVSWFRAECATRISGLPPAPQSAASAASADQPADHDRAA
jgi:xanthosine utilization system XapX-like protein